MGTRSGMKYPSVLVTGGSRAAVYVVAALRALLSTIPASLYGHRALTGTVAYPLTYTRCIVFEAPPSTPTKCEGPYGRVIFVWVGKPHTSVDSRKRRLAVCCLRERWLTPHVGRHLCCQLAVWQLARAIRRPSRHQLPKGCAV
jgi:hypothetical protein